MKKFLLKFILFFLVLNIFLFVFSPKNTKAQTDFEHVINASYTVNENKSASASYEINTTNKVGSTFLRSFSIRLPFKPQNIKTANSSVALTVQSTKEIPDSNLYEIEFIFTNPVVGQNRSFDWSFSFEIDNLLLSHSMQSAIILPTFADSVNIASYNISLAFPKKLGEIAYIYSDAGILDNGSMYVLTFTGGSIKSNNLLVLLGKNQQYEIEIFSNENAVNTVFLPINNEFQDIIFNQFSEKETNHLSSNSDLQVEINGQDRFSGLITTFQGYERSKEGEFIERLDEEFIQRRANSVNTSDLNKYSIAELIYLETIGNYSISQFKLDTNMSLDLSSDRNTLNIIEINQLYRYLLGYFDIESRGVFGYVFPIQPFERNRYFVEPHIWTEIWDGEKWVSADPAWLISSRGTSYFDKNNYHHIKFGNYYNQDTLNQFIDSTRFISIKPIEKMVESNSQGDIEVRFDEFVYLNKELKFSLINKSNNIKKIEKININSSFPTKLMHEKESIYLMPNEIYSTTALLEYNLIPINREINVQITLDLVDRFGEVTVKQYDGISIIQSNISSYLSYFVVIGFVVISGISLLGSNIYRIRTKVDKVN
jgi:hypothetical protein